MAVVLRIAGGAVAVVGAMSLGGAAGLATPKGEAEPADAVAASLAGAFDDLDSGSVDDSAAAEDMSEPASVSVVGVLPPPPPAPPQPPDVPTVAPVTFGNLGIPGVVLDAYRRAAATVAAANPGCGIRWEILAGIGKVESGHANGGRVTADGDADPRILGPVLNGGAFAAISDHDGGRWDGDARWDRAVGPMQFIPGTWKSFGVDGSGDGLADPNNVFDAATAAARYLCHGGNDLSTDTGLRAALLRYNNSSAYVERVLAWIKGYESGMAVVLNDPGPVIDPVTGVVTPPPLAPPASQAPQQPTSPAAGPAAPGTPAPTEPTPTTEPTETPTTTPTPTPEPEPTPTTEPTPTPEPTPTTEPTPTPEPTPTTEPTPEPTPTTEPTPTPEPAETPTTEPEPTETPTAP